MVETNFLKISRNIYKTFITQERLKMFILIAIIFMGILSNSIEPYIFGKIIDQITVLNIYELKKYILSYFFISLISLVLSILETIYAQNLIINITNNLKSIVFKDVLKIRVKNLEKKERGGLFERLEGDTQKVISFYIDVVSSSIVIIVNLAVATYFMLKISFKLAMFSMLFIPISFLINIYFKRKKTIIQMELKKFYDKYIGFAMFSIYHIEDYKVYRLEQNSLNKFNEYLIKYKHILMKDVKNHQLSEGLKDFFSIVFNIGNLYLASKFIFKKNLTIGLYIAFNSYAVKLFSAINNIMNLNMDAGGVIVSIERLNNIISEEKEENPINNVSIKTTDVSILLEKLSFGYEKNKVLREVNLKIYRHGLYSIVGENGCGKSTLLKLLVKFYDRDSGKIFINNQDIDYLKYEEIRKNILYIPKENFILNESIYDNLTIADDKISIKEVEKACRKVDLHDTIIKTYNGYNSILGTNGINFSSGQEQKLMLARILLSKAPIIIIDEITANLDGYAEKEAITIIHEISKTKIVIAVTHSLNVAKASDGVFVLDNGYIDNYGDHLSLIQSSEMYKKLFENYNSIK